MIFVTNTRLHDWVGGVLHLLFLFLEQAVPPVAAVQGQLCWLRAQQRRVWVQKGLQAGKPQPSVTRAAFLISAQPCPRSRLVPSSAAAPVQPAKPLDALSSVSAPKPT